MQPSPLRRFMHDVERYVAMPAPLFFVRLTALCECVWDDHVILVVVLVLLVSMCIFRTITHMTWTWSGRPHFLLFSNFGPPAVRGAKTWGGGTEGGGLRCAEPLAEPTYFSRVAAKRPTLAGLGCPSAASSTLVDLTPTYLTLYCRYYPRVLLKPYIYFKT